MPEPRVVLPREKPVPKEENKTKWEKFRAERGMAPRKKRSRLVFDPITKDWVPRWGKGSVKKIAEKTNFVMEEKPIHRIAGVDPFTFAKAEKNAKMEKQKLAQVKNKINSVSVNNMKNEIRVLSSKNAPEAKK
jgi:regulator of ribosome biosynthesis